MIEELTGMLTEENMGREFLIRICKTIC